MKSRIIDDITDFIFVSDKPQKSDIIFLPGASFPEIPEKAAVLYHDGYAPLLLPSGSFSVKNSKFAGVKTKQELYNKEYRTECEFFFDVLTKNNVPQQSILCEDKSGYTIENAFSHGGSRMITAFISNSL